MTLALLVRALVRGKARFACAAAGVAAAFGAVVFVFSLTATNAAQAPARARAATAPWSAWRVMPERAERPERGGGARPDLALDLVSLTIDYRPGGRVLQGPPMRAVLAVAPAENPWVAAPLVEGRWPAQDAKTPEFVCTRGTLVRFRRGQPPPVGTEIKFVGEHGTLVARLVGYLADTKLPRTWPGVFANPAAFARLGGERKGRLALWRTPPPHAPPGLETPDSPMVVAAFTGDEARRMDYARPLLLIAAALTALCLLVNSLLLAVEANRRPLAILRVTGLTRGGVVRLVAAEALLATAVGLVAGGLVAAGALVLYVAADPVAFPVGTTFAWRAIARAAALAPFTACAAVLFALRPALAVRPLEAVTARPKRRRRGMAIAFACGFAAFVAVEVWGASLMRGFVPSPEWPDAIVSLLPEGASSFGVEKLRKLPGVKRISELLPLQVDFHPVVPMPLPPGRPAPVAGRGGRPPRPMNRNALFLAAEWLPRFRFLEGTWEEAERAIRTSDACVIPEMISRAHNLHRGDKLRLSLAAQGGRTVVELPIAGVVDLNWHMVTSRGLVRGLNGAPGMTDGPVFASFDTVEALDPRPAAHVKMTHLWVEYEPAFLAEKGVFPAGRAIEAAIAKALGLDAGTAADAPSTVRLHARDEIADGTLAHGSDVIGQAARVPFVFLAILAIGFIAMLVADADAARHELAVLRAVGATRVQLAARLAAGALKTALKGILLGWPIGALTGWLFALKTASVWPGMPPYFEVPVRVLLEGSLGALAFVLILAVPAALRLVRTR